MAKKRQDAQRLQTRNHGFHADKPWLKHYTMNCPPKIAYKNTTPGVPEAFARST